MVVEHCEWDFYMIFHFKEAELSKTGCRALFKRMGDLPYPYDNEQK